MRGKRFYVFIFILITFSDVIASSNNIPSKLTITDSTIVNQYINSSFGNESFIPFSIYNSLEAFELAKKIKYQKGIDNIYELGIRNYELGIKNATIDLRNILNDDLNLRMILYDSLGYYYLREGKEDKALDCFRSIENLPGFRNLRGYESLKKSVMNSIAGCYYKLGENYRLEDNPEISIEYFNKALNIYKGLENRIGIANCYNMIGRVNIIERNNLLAIDYLLKSLKINEELNNKPGLASNNSNFAIVYTTENDYVKALNYVHNALKTYEELKDKRGALKCYNIYGYIYTFQINYVKAIENYNHAFKISEELGDIRSMANIINNIGDAYMNIKDYSKAYECFDRGLKINEKQDNKGIKVYLLVNKAKINFEQKKYDEALELALKSLNIAKEIKELLIENHTYEILKNIYKIKGDYKKALEYGRLYKSTGDSLYNAEKSKKINDIQTKYESEKKEFKISQLEQEKKIQNLNYEKSEDKRKNQMIFFIGILLIIIVSGFVFYNRFKFKQKQIIEREKVLQRELRYHDVIDAQEKERSHIAKDLHDSLGQMLSTIIHQTECVEDSKEFDSAENHKVLKNTINYIKEASKEVRNISHHLMPEALIRAGLIPAIGDIIEIINRTNRIKIKLTSNGFDKRMNESTEINIFRIIQELIENVIKHTDATEMSIEMSFKNSQISMIIADNGKGFDNTKINELRGIDLKNIYSRVGILNGKIDIFSERDKGTRIIINIGV